MESLELVVDHVAKFSRKSGEVEVARALSRGGVCGRRHSRAELTRVAFGRHLSAWLDDEGLVNGAAAHAAKLLLASDCHGALSEHKCQLTCATVTARSSEGLLRRSEFEYGRVLV